MEYLRMYVKHFHLLKHIRFLVSGTENTQHTRKSLVRAQSQSQSCELYIHLHGNPYISMEVSFKWNMGDWNAKLYTWCGITPSYLRTVVWKNWANLTLKCLVQEPVILEHFNESPDESTCSQPYSLRSRVLEGIREEWSWVFFSFPVEGVQCEEALWFLFHGTVGCCGAGWRKTGILCLWWDYGV